MLDTKETQSLNTLATWMGVPADWLYKLINFESAWNPLAKNKLSGARGLIQFMPQTAKDLGYTSADALVNKYPDISSQLLGPVAAYFKLPGKKGPYPTKQSLYMAVFYPTHRSVKPDTVFSSLVRKQNPGIDTVKDYVNYVEGIRKPFVKGSGFVTAMLLVGGYFLAKHFRIF
jgi:hypothetical protein